MPYFIQRGLAANPSMDASERIIGVNNGLPASEIDATMCVDAINRLAVLDAINRGRPGVTKLATIPGAIPLIVEYFQNGIYLVTDGSILWTWNGTTLTQVATGLPFLPIVGANQLNSAPAITSVYFNAGAGLYKWSGAAFTGVALPAQAPNVSFPTYYTNRLILARTGTNDLIWSDILNPENYGPLNNSTTVTTTLDAEPSDAITGIAGFQLGMVIAFKKAKIYAIYCPPTTAVLNFTITPISTVIGCAEHNTIAQVGNDLFFLSESGYGIYKLSALMNSSNVTNIGLAGKISEPIKKYISRLNWQAVNKARAVVWQDLYLLSVPIDNSSENNAVFVYSSALDAWQGIWTFNNVLGVSYGTKAWGINPSSALGGSELLMSTSDLSLNRMTRPDFQQYNDISLAGGSIDVLSQLTTKGFRFGCKSNQVLPYSVLLNFFQSQATVQVDGITDLATQNAIWIGPSSGSQSNLPMNLPVNLGGSGINPVRVNSLVLGSCRQVQYRVSGANNWSVMSVEADGFETLPVFTQ